MGVIQATNMLTQFVVMSTIADKYNPSKMFLFGGILSAASFFSFPVAQDFYQMVGTQVLLGLSWALFYVGGLRFVEINTKEDNVVATGTGLFNASISIAQLVGPLIAIALFWISDGYTLSMNVAGSVTAIAMIFYFLYNQRNDSKPN